MAPKLNAHEPATFFLLLGHGNSRNSDFLGKTLRTQKFSTGTFLGLLPTESLHTQDSENVVGLGDQASVWKL